ncbi:zinc transporter 9 [Aplysia californica]|uniref:Proton-coupled zinc antiporter SLC30A9, mitochondrial n=1 Tax=Aplysia californica TaxID=6500 RepID=A0ABM0K7Y1_APLCA|nr:zinc transporter 9 [Aplysia californica]XP_005110929.1 zinc transporter 9 [Aplysia californica]
MLRPGCAELRALLSSLNQLRQAAVRPVLLCRECQRHLSTQKPVSSFLVIPSSTPAVPASGVQSLGFSSLRLRGFRHDMLCVVRPSRHFSMKSDKTTGVDEKGSHVLRDVSAAASKGSKTLASGGGDEASESEAQADGTSEKKKNKLLRITPRSRKPNPVDYSYTGNIYILPQRALMEYLLKPNDIEDLPKYTRRSPYADGTRITLYLRSDVEEVALRKWGGFDTLNKEKARLRGMEHSGKYDASDWRSIFSDMSASGYSNPDSPDSFAMQGHKPDTNPHEPTFLKSGSTKVVLSAILVNGANSLFKLIAWLYTGSHSMFSEFIHSCADTMNQIILAVGLYHSFKKPDTDHPYGYRNLRHISSLISGVGIFFLGTGLSWYHSIQGFMHPTDLGSLHWCIATLVGSFISEGATLVIAVNQVRKSSKESNMSFVEYVLRGIDPNVNVVLLEDLAAVVGVGIAGACITISHVTGSPFADAVGSAVIGTLLGSVAGFIVYNSTNQLVGRSIPMDERQDISMLLERDRMIRSLHDIKATQMGGIVRYKAEVDFDGREITRAYLYKQDLELLLEEAQGLKTVEDFEIFMMNHGEKIIDALGEEVDRIEKALKAKHPEIRHVDLEAL